MREKPRPFRAGMDSATGAAGFVGFPEKYCYILSMENKQETIVIKVRLRNMPKGGGEDVKTHGRSPDGGQRPCSTVARVGA